MSDHFWCMFNFSFFIWGACMVVTATNIIDLLIQGICASWQFVYFIKNLERITNE